MQRSPVFLFVAAVSGLIFGFGLAISRMTNPAKIKDFLDIAAIPTGGWDPSLAFVMGGGVLVGLIGMRAHAFIARPLVADKFVLPDRHDIDTKLIAGSAIFGVGWGISGFCPGPAIANLGLVPGDVLLFVVTMFAASWLTGAVLQRIEHTPQTGAHVAPG